MSRFYALRLFLLGSAITMLAAAGFPQSTSQNFPTPVTANEINGEIKARDVGDPRLTTYFYTFDGTQGDIFVNVVSKNFNGDIDIFIAEGLKPLSKIVVYADTADSETGRVIYLRKPEKLILRVEGRSPNDDPATFKLKFAGSFVAAVDTGEQEPGLPSVKVSNDTGIRVNSVGTIIERIAKPKATPKPAEEVAAAEEKPEKPADIVADAKDNPSVGDETSKERSSGGKVEVVVTDNIPKAGTAVAKVKNPPAARNRRTRRRPVDKPASDAVTANKDRSATAGVEGKADEGKTEAVEPPVSTSSTETKTGSVKAAPARTSTRRRRATSAKPPPTAKPKEPDPLENIHLVILFKDGTRIEKPMSEVLRFSVDRGILTVISRDGTIGRYPILDVLKTTIE